jgi:RimJ/RimL family protein N-acetyltransferase
MHLRVLTGDDAIAYQALRLAALQESPTSFSSSYEEERSRTVAQVEAFLTGSPERIVFGAFSEKELVGVCGLGREQSLKQRHVGFIRSMYVAPDFRERGIGRKLLEAVLDRATAWPEIEQLTLAVTATNTVAVALYERFGFIPFGQARRTLRIGGKYFDQIHMVWRPGAA